MLPLIKKVLIKGSNSLLPEQEIQEMFYQLHSRNPPKYFYQCTVIISIFRTTLIYCYYDFILVKLYLFRLWYWQARFKEQLLLLLQQPQGVLMVTLLLFKATLQMFTGNYGVSAGFPCCGETQYLQIAGKRNL